MTQQQTISNYYETDHDRLDELFKRFQQLKRVDYPQAKRYFREFKFGLQRHIIWEEEILFPLFEQKTGMTNGGPTFVMRQEHRLIGKHLEAIHDKVKIMDPNSNDDEQALLNVLFAHNQKEEQILYPMIDRSVNDSERTKVFETMQSLPEERYAICCQEREVA
jgi:regulator of cell morphogenesis and NO signaling